MLSKTKIIVGSLVKKDLFWGLLVMLLVLALADFSYLSHGFFSLHLRNLLCIAILLVAILLIEENFPVTALLIFLPNTVIAFFVAIKFESTGLFLGSIFSLLLIVLAVSAFQMYLSRYFISESSFNQVKSELKEQKDTGIERLLNFSLLGCIHEHEKIIAQTYHVLENVFKADSAMIFLAEPDKNQLVPHPRKGEAVAGKLQPILVPPDFWKKAAYDPEKGLMSVINGKSRLPSLRELIPQANLDAVAAMPVSANNQVIGLITIIRQKPENRHFLDPLLFAAFGYVVGASLDNCSLHENRKKMLDSAEKKTESVRAAFGKYVSEAVLAQLFNNKEIATLGGRKMKVSILMADLRGFTALSSVLPIENLVSILNAWFNQATDIILKSYGTIDKYMGDCIMVIFGAPLEKPDDPLRCAFTAFRLLEKFNEFKQSIKLPEGYELGLGISISTGPAIVGNFGSSNRMEYTAIGETVNLASRLEKLADSSEIVVDSNTFNELPGGKFKFECRENVKVKGLSEQTVYCLTEIVQPRSV